MKKNEKKCLIKLLQCSYEATDSLLNFENVKYYNNDEFEIKGYRKVMEEFQAVEYISTASFRYGRY